MTPTLMRQIYQKHGIKYKAIKYRKFIAPDFESQLPIMIDQMRQELDEAKHNKELILYLDETIFSRKAMLKNVWARKHENGEIDEAMLNEPTMALLMSISQENGVEPWKIFKRSVNTDKFCQYLQMVRDRHPDKKLCIFMDNLRVHTSKRARK